MAIADVGDSDFKSQVIRRSYKLPVIVDYWAAWCGPCRQLGPVLEKIAEEPDSGIFLAKLDTERNRMTASKYSIYSIPHVKAFRNGQVIDEFTGALPETLVRRFISKVIEAPIPAAQIKGSPNPETRLKQAEQHLKRGRGFEAFVLLTDFPESAQSDRANHLIPLARFLFDMDDGDGMTGLEELDEEYLAAAAAMKKGKPDFARAHLAKAVDLGEKFDSTYTRKVINSFDQLVNG